MKKTKVLNIIQKYHPSKGGAELFMKNLSEYQSAILGYDVNVWTTNAYAPDTLWDLDNNIIKKESEDVEGVHVKRFSVGKGLLKNKYINKIIRVLFDRFPDFTIANLASCPTAYGMFDEAKKTDFSQYAYITVSSTPYYFLFYIGYLISKKYNIPYIIAPAFHTGENQRDPLRKKYFKKTAIPFFEYASRILVNTEAEQDIIIKFCSKYGVSIDDKKFVIVGQGVFLNQITNGNGATFRKKYNLKYPIVFQMGSKSYEKGSLSLVEGMKRVWDKGIKCHLIFGGPYNKEFSQYLEKVDKKYQEYILNIDNISDEEKFDLFDASNIFSMVSKTDSFGIVYLEAWAYSKPVLACRNKVMSEIIDDKINGYLINFGDINEISEKIIGLLENEDRAKQMGEMGKKKVEKEYDLRKVLKKVNQVYLKL